MEKRIREGSPNPDSVGSAPIENQELRAEAKVIGETLLALYGKYMPPQTKREALRTADKFVTKSGGENRKLAKGHTAGYLRKDGVIIINRDYLEYLTAILAFKNVTRLEIFSTLLAMEETHRLQDQTLSHMFLECGSSYYAREVSRYLGKRWVSETFLFGRADFYEKLIAGVEDCKDELGYGGEAVHHLFFGTPLSKNDKHLVYSFLDDDRDKLLKLFPELRRNRR